MTPTLLLILDGWGLTEKGEGNAPWVAATPHLDDLMARCPHSRLAASGREVGLPAGYMGNSERWDTSISVRDASSIRT